MSIFKKLFGPRTADEHLIRVVKNGDVSAAAALLGAASMQAKDKAGWTVLPTAVYKENLPMVELLLNHHANPNEIQDGTPVLHIAAAKGNVPILELLLQKGAQVSIKDVTRGCSALAVAVMKGQVEPVKCLLRAGLNPNEVVDKDGTTLLFEAAEAENYSVIEALIEAGADPNHRRPDGVTPLLFAAHAGKVEGLRALLDAGADPLLEFTPGLSASTVAEQEGHKEAAQLLRTAEEENKNNPFITRFQTGHPLLAAVKLLADRDVPQFLDWLADPTRRDELIFSVKCAVEDEHAVEHVWMIVTQRDGDALIGKIDTDLVTVKSVKGGDPHRVLISDIEDLTVTNKACAILLGGHHLRATGVIE
jgi:ankyrin repeat protein